MNTQPSAFPQRTPFLYTIKIYMTHHITKTGNVNKTKLGLKKKEEEGKESKVNIYIQNMYNSKYVCK